MAKELTTGLMVTEGVVEWATVRSAKSRGVVARHRADLPPASADDGDDAAGVRAVAVKAACHGVKGSVALALSSEDVLLRVLDLPLADEEDLAGMVELQIDKFSPFPIDTMVVSHEVLSRGSDSQTVLVAGVKLGIVEPLGRRLDAAGIRPDRVDVAVLGWWRSLNKAGAVPKEGRRVFLLFEEGVPQIIVAEDGVPVVFRVMGEVRDLSGPELVEEVAREVGYTLMTLELERGGAGESSISVVASGERPDELMRRLGEECSCVVETVDPASVGSAAEGVARRAADRADALDLTPVSWRSAESGRAFKKRMGVAVGFVVALWALAAGGFFGGLYYQERKLAWLESERDRWAEPATSVRTTRRRVAMIRRYMDRRHSALETLREASALLPQGIDLTSFNYIKGDGVSVKGTAGNVNQVYTFKSSLDASELFLETRLSGPTQVRKTGKQSFEIEMRLPPEVAMGGDA